MVKGRKPSQFGTINMTESGSYRARYIGPDGRRYSRTFPDEETAADWLSANRSDIAKDKWQSPTAKAYARMTVAEWAEQWLSDGAERWAERTARDYRARLRLHLLPELGHKVLETVSREDIRRWHARLKKRCGPGATRMAYMTTRALFQAAVELDMLSETPVKVRGADRHNPVRRIERDGEGYVLTPEEVRNLANAMPDRLVALVWIGARCGLRLGELMGLRRCDVDLESRTIHVRRQALACPGGVHESSSLKTPSSRRRVPIPPQVSCRLWRLTFRTLRAGVRMGCSFHGLSPMAGSVSMKARTPFGRLSSGRLLPWACRRISLPTTCVIPVLRL